MASEDWLPIESALHVSSTDSVHGSATAYEGSMSFDLESGDSEVASLIDEAVAAQMQRIEYAIRGAILAGYDGVDVYHEVHSAGIEKIVPWRGNPPEPRTGYTGERYFWEWFDEETLVEIARTGRAPPTVREELLDAE